MGAPVGNQFAVGNEGGRPPIHTDPEKLNVLVKDYFEWIQGEKGEKEIKLKDEDGNDYTEKHEYWIRKPEPPTVTGLALHIGFCSKNTLYEYAKKDEFSDYIKRGLTQIEKYHEMQAAYGDKCTGNIFVLKNFGWKDTHDYNHAGEIKGNETPKIVFVTAKDE